MGVDEYLGWWGKAKEPRAEMNGTRVCVSNVTQLVVDKSRNSTARNRQSSDHGIGWVRTKWNYLCMRYPG